MIVQEDFLKKIKDFGLNTYEAKIWTALLSRGIATAGELSDISNVPRSRSYDVLESLEKKGFIVMKLGKPIKYIAVNPDEVVERVKKKVNEDAEMALSMMDELKDSDVLKELTQLHSTGIEALAPEDLAGSVKGQSNVYDHLNLMLKEAEQEIILVTSEEGLNRKAETLLRQMKKAHKRGVSIKIGAPLTEKNADAVATLKGIADVRNIAINARFTITDESQITFMLTDDTQTHPSYDIGIWVNTEPFAKALSQLFHLVWEDVKVNN